MNGLMKKLGLGIALGATALTAAAPAEAQRWYGRGGYYGGYHHHGDFAGGALLGGILGLGVGAAIASSNRPAYYDRGYYAPPPPPPVVERGYYENAYPVYPAYAPRCFSQWRYDPYYGQQVQVRVCN